jgi:hypothetical protein
MAMSDDYNHLEPHYHSDSEKPQFGNIKPVVFVSILDPFKDPPFIPSPTKSQPLWMDLLPNNIFRERLQQTQQCSNSKESQRISEQRISETQNDNRQPTSTPSCHGAGIQVTPISGPDRPIEPTTGDTTPRKTSIDKVSGLTSRHMSVHEGLGTPRKQSLPESLLVVPASEGTLPKRGRRTTISFDPKIKKERYVEDLEDPSSPYKLSRNIEPTCSPTTESTAPPPRERTPWPRIKDPTAKATDYFTPNSKTAANSKPLQESCFETPEKKDRLFNAPITGKKNEVACPTPVGQISVPLLSKSSEYLERYKPQTPDPGIEKYIAKPPQPVFEKLGKERSGLQVDDKTKTAGITLEIRPLDIDEEKMELDEKGKGRVGMSREALQKELERVFRERQKVV